MVKPLTYNRGLIMVHPASLQRPQATRLEEPKSSSSHYFSYPFNTNQTLGIALIVAIVFCPLLGVARAALASTRDMPQLSPLPNTCSALSIPPATITAYLQGAEVTSSFITAKNSDHPAEQAIAARQAIAALEDVPHAQRCQTKPPLKDQIQELRVKEADACNEAAKLAGTPEEKLAWVSRGLKVLQAPKDPYNAAASGSDSLRRGDPACDVAAALYSTAAEAFKAAPSHDLRSVTGKILEHPFSESKPLFAAAKCRIYGAYYSQLNLHDTQALFNEEIEILKCIVDSTDSLEDKVELQEGIVSTCITAKNFASDAVQSTLSAHIVSEAMAASSMYRQLISESDPHKAIYYTIKRALKLETAAYFAPNLRQSVERYREARDIVQRAWDQSPFDCQLYRDFQPVRRPYVRYFAPDIESETLLDRLKRATQLVEQELEKANAGVLQSAWNAFHRWIGL